MVSNCSISESGTINGQRGDQTGKEYYIRPWYDSGWDYVMRHPDPKIQKLIQYNAIAAAQNDNIGYGQSDRLTFWNELTKVGYDASKITTPCNADCSSSVCAVCKAAGFLSENKNLQNIPLTTARYIPSTFVSAGFESLRDTKYLRSKDYLQPGDVLVNTSKHTCIYIGSDDIENLIVPTSTTTGTQLATMFVSKYEIGDAVVREFCMLDDSWNRKISTQGKIKLSIINYAPLLENIAEANGIYMSANEVYYSNLNIDTTQLDGNCKIVVDYLISRGLNGAAACGIAGNIFHESGFHTNTVGDNGTSFGICQWHNSRGTSMKKFVGANWANNLTGQLEYLWYDLENNYLSVLNYMKGVTNSESGCKSAADYFVRNFEMPANVNDESLKRQKTAIEYFNSLIMTTASNGTVSIGGAGDLKSYRGQDLTLKKSVSVPLTVQYGLLENYTNYSYFFSRWSWKCRTIADIWAEKGKTSDKGIATIDGHYLVAMSPKFGVIGDLVVIHLENGESFSCILGDAKGSDARSEWGHIVYKNLVDIIEWEAIGSSVKASQGVNIQLGSWKKVKVSSVDNYGTWLDK